MEFKTKKEEKHSDEIELLFFLKKIISIFNPRLNPDWLANQRPRLGLDTV